MTFASIQRQARENHRVRLLAAHRARPRPTSYDDVKHPLSAIVHGMVQENHPCWTFVEQIACCLFGPISSKTSLRLMHDRNIVAMDALECLRERGYLRREGDMPKAGNEGNANQVYLIERSTTPFPLGNPSDLPIAHSVVLDAFEVERNLDEAKLIRILSGATVISPARGMNAYHRVSGTILNDLKRLRLVVQTSGGWYVAPSL